LCRCGCCPRRCLPVLEGHAVAVFEPACQDPDPVNQHPDAVGQATHRDQDHENNAADRACHLGRGLLAHASQACTAKAARAEYEEDAREQLENASDDVA